MSMGAHKYSRTEAICRLLNDRRRYPNRKNHTTVYWGDGLFICLTDTIRWLPMLYRIDLDTGKCFPGNVIEGWPGEEEIQALIDQSAADEAAWLAFREGRQ